MIIDFKMTTNLQDILDNIGHSIDPGSGEGHVADYIPALAQVNPKMFGVSIATINGETAHYGDANVAFSIQSISKIFTLTLALINNRILWKRVHNEPSGSAFNSIAQLELEKGIPRNPFINAGALVISDILLKHQRRNECTQQLLKFVQGLANDTSIQIDPVVAASEIATAHRNASLVHFMKSFGNIDHSIEDVLDVYCQQCSIAMSCEQLSRSLLFLANRGVNPLSNTPVIDDLNARRINAMMMLCGHYDASGDFAHRVGLPGKSGVGGGIVAIIPSYGVITVWSPKLNTKGSSSLGIQLLEAITNQMKWNIL